MRPFAPLPAGTTSRLSFRSRVYDELTVNVPDVETPPIDTVIEEG